MPGTPMSREVQTAPLTQQDQSRHRGGVYFGSGHLAKNQSGRENEPWRKTKREKVSLETRNKRSNRRRTAKRKRQRIPDSRRSEKKRSSTPSRENVRNI